MITLDSRLRKYIKDRKHFKVLRENGKKIPKINLESKYNITPEDRVRIKAYKMNKDMEKCDDDLSNFENMFNDTEFSKRQSSRNKQEKEACNMLSDYSELDKFFSREKLFGISSNDTKDTYPNSNRINRTGVPGMDELRDSPMSINNHVGGMEDIERELRSASSELDKNFIPDERDLSYKLGKLRDVPGSRDLPINSNPALDRINPDIESDVRFGFTTRGGRSAGYRNPFEHKFSYISSDQISDEFLEHGTPTRNLKYSSAVRNQS